MDTLKGFKIHTGENQLQLMLSYLLSSNYFQYLRNTYQHFLRFSEEEKISLLKSAEMFRVKDDKTTMMISYNQETISILIYGELKHEDKIMIKGNYFITPSGQFQVQFLKKTSILMLNKTLLQATINTYQQYYSKLDILQKIFPIQLLGIGKKACKTIIKNSNFVSQKNKKNYIINQDKKLGIYILFQGNYVILRNFIKLAQLHKDYFGEESLWKPDFDFDLQSQSYQYSYIHIPTQLCLKVFSSQVINKLKQFYEKKKQSRDNIQRNYLTNLQFTHRFLKQIKEKPLQNKFKKQQIVQFNQILQKMSKKSYKPKWKVQQQKIQSQKLKKMRQNRVYIPKKTKSRYFSTITNDQQNLISISHNMQFVDNQQKTLFKPKLYLHQRSKTQQLFKKSNFDKQSSRNNTKELRRTVTDKSKNKTYLSFYSEHYDRSLSFGMGNLSKMRRYDNLKKASTLKRGQKILSLEDRNKELSKSFRQLQTQSLFSNRYTKKDPKLFLQRSIRNNKILANKLLQSSKNRYIDTR